MYTEQVFQDFGWLQKIALDSWDRIENLRFRSKIDIKFSI